MRSSWISAAAWNSSSAAAAAVIGSPAVAAGPAPAPVAERRAQPLAAAHQRRDRLDERPAVRATGLQRGGLALQERGQGGVDPGAQPLGVQRAAGQAVGRGRQGVARPGTARGRTGSARVFSSGVRRGRVGDGSAVGSAA